MTACHCKLIDLICSWPFNELPYNKKKATLQFSFFSSLVDLPNLALFLLWTLQIFGWVPKKPSFFNTEKVTIRQYLWLIHINYNHLLVFTMCVLWPFFFIHSRSVVLFLLISFSLGSLALWVPSSIRCGMKSERPHSNHSDKNVWCDPNNNTQKNRMKKKHFNYLRRNDFKRVANSNARFNSNDSSKSREKTHIHNRTNCNLLVSFF